MIVEKSFIQKILISEVQGLDPITVYLEQLGERQGKITVEYASKSWSTFFSGCGDSGIATFVSKLSSEYLIDRFAPQITKYVPNFEQFDAEMRMKIVEMRRQDELSKDFARALFDVETWRGKVTQNPYEPLINPFPEFAEEFERADFQAFDVPECISSEYRRFERIVKAVIEALKPVKTNNIDYFEHFYQI